MKTRLLAACAALLDALAACGWIGPPPFRLTPAGDRNVLFVTIDTLRADALGAYGGRATTPNLDRLAASGARFTFAHSHAVVTLVSHASILTGRYPYEHGIRDNTGYRLPPAMPTPATRLKAAGFATGAFVGGFPLDHRFGLSSGFDLYDDRSRTCRRRPPRPATASAAPTLVVGSALEWIGRQHRQVVRMGPRLRSARPLPAAARMGGAVPVGSISRRSLVDRRALGAAVRSSRRRGAADAGCCHRRSRRKPGRARRSDPQRLCLRVDAARAADRRGDPPGRRASPRGRG